MDDWPQWRDKIIELGRAESSTRPNIKKTLGNLKDSENSDKEGMLINITTIALYAILWKFHLCILHFVEHQDANSLELLCKLLYPRGFGKSVIFIKNYEVGEYFYNNEYTYV